jgi:hypothetical protein
LDEAQTTPRSHELRRVVPFHPFTIMPTLVLTNFNIVTAALGGFITIFALVSYLLKERFYLSEACE